MTPGMSTTLHIGGQEVRKGVRISYGSNRETIRFTIQSVCVSTDPFTWRGEVSFAGTTILTTDVVEDHNVAGRQAEAALTERLTHLFSNAMTQ